MEINTSEMFEDVMNKVNDSNNNSMEEKVLTPDEFNQNFNEMDKSEKVDDELGLYCEEEDLIEELEDEFSYQIIERGKDYYNSGSIVLCCKHDNKYYAKVRGTNDKPYIVRVEITEDGVDYDCTCPCTYPCKHEYAVLMAITNQEYSNIELKPEMKEKKDTLQNVIKQIPADELKEYLLSPKGQDYVCFEMEAFEEYFRKYYPSQSYEYYYNNLYNALAVDGEYIELIDTYIDKIRQYISNKEFEESFKIFRSIISAYNDTNTLNVEPYIVSQFPTLGMLLRIIFRKCDARTKQDIRSWIIELENDNYYNNLYLEDIVVMINYNN
ncbi:MAG: hypothetical protein J6A52_01950 [Bacilli bacterium]|nr:hypothetical protein [Bacilli bacterium]